jgi:SRSO17 transposase
LAGSAGSLIIDVTGFRKQGQLYVGVPDNTPRRSARSPNCQVAVTLPLATGWPHHVALARAAYSFRQPLRLKQKKGGHGITLL